MRCTGAVSLVLTVSLFGAAESAAHIRVTYPVPRYEYDIPGYDPGQKLGPCGTATADAPPTGVVTELVEGQEITVTWDETIDHPGHFRIALDMTGTDDFSDPGGFDDKAVSGNIIAYVEDTGGSTFQHTFRLPDQACDPCTLQVAQVMTDKPPYGDGNDLYYWCADIRILRAAGTGGAGQGGATGQGGAGAAGGPPFIEEPEDEAGCSCRLVRPDDRSPAGEAWLFFLGLAALAWRRSG